MAQDDHREICERLDEIAASVRNIVFRAFPKASPEEREDVEQEVKLKLWNMVARGKNIDNLRSYLYKVVYTTTLDVLEERIRIESKAEMIERNEAQIASRLEVLSPEILMERKERLEIVKRYIDSLAPRRKSVLRLHLSGMDLKEIAGHLALTKNQARHLLYRGIDDLVEAVNGKAAERSAERGTGRELESGAEGGCGGGGGGSK